MNANFGLLDELTGVPPRLLRDKAAKREAYAARALAVLDAWRREHGVTPVAADAVVVAAS
jgi:methylenetetrahydrofolate--tRNA-(uracil-5-)-methyltransferase